MLASSRPGNWWKRCLVVLLVLEGCADAPSKPASHQFKTGAARMGVVSGFVLDDETGAPIASAQISVAGQPVRARADGSFDATVPAGRARVEVKNDGFIQTVREVAVGDIALSLPFKLARKEQARAVGSAGGSFPFREAFLDVPTGAFLDGTLVSMTYLGRVRVAVTSNQPQFIDADETPRRVVATVDLDASAPPAMPVRARVPVPPDATMESVKGFALGENGEWTTPIMPISVTGGLAEFALTGNTRFGVAIDTRKADGKNVGYLVTEGGDAAMNAGQVLAGGSEVMTASRAVSLVDPQGSRIEVAPASRARTEVPAPEGGVPGRVAAYAGMGTLFSGSLKVLVPKRDSSLIKLTLETPATKLDVRGTAFTVSTCESGSGFVDVLSVTEGTVDAEFSGKTEPVSAGDSVTFCTSCAAGTQPMCGAAEPDAGSPAPDVLPTLPPDAAAVADLGMVAVMPDASVLPDVPLGRDAGAPMEDAATRVTPDAGIVLPDAAVVTPPDATVVPPPDAAVAPPPDAPLAPDLPPLPVDMMPAADAAPPPPDMAPPPPDAAMPMFDAAVIAQDAAPLMPDASAAKLSISPPMADFGTVQVGTPSAVVDFTVTNVGDLPSGVPSVAVPSDYVVEANTCTAALAGKDLCVVRVKMLPAGPGPRGGNLIVTAAPGGQVSAGLMGTGADAARLDVQPKMQAFGSVAPGQNSAPFTFTVKNVGGLKSGIPSLALSPTSAPFTITQNFCTSQLDPGGTCQIAVAFNAPSTTGQVSGQLVASASPGGNAAADLFGNSTYVEITPNAYDFGDTATGTGANMKVKDFTVWHLGPAGTSTLFISNMLNGADARDFTVTNDTCGANGLQPGGSCTISVAFTPATLGAHSGTLDIAAHLATGAPQGTDKAKLSGNGI
jgi:hypothetical protein